MQEIEKLYENAGIEPVELDYPDNLDPIYPEFTADKQLELIKWLVIYLKGFDFRIAKNKENNFVCWVIYNKNKTFHQSINKDLSQSLAGLINNLWQSLTDVEKEQIKEILNE